MSKHTPGPWTHYDDTGPEGKTGRHEIVALGKTIARIYATKGHEEVDRGNASLITAAPELLAACKAVDTFYVFFDSIVPPTMGNGARETLRMVRAAIARTEQKP